MQRTGYSCQIIMKLNFSPTDFSKSIQISISKKIRPVQTEMFHADRRTAMTKLIAAYRSFANAPKKTALHRPSYSVGIKNTIIWTNLFSLQAASWVLRSSAVKAGNNSPATARTAGPSRQVQTEWAHYQPTATHVKVPDPRVSLSTATLGYLLLHFKLPLRLGHTSSLVQRKGRRVRTPRLAQYACS